MQKEIEAKFLNVDIESIRETLRQLGASCEKPMCMMRRQVFYVADQGVTGEFVRVRDEGDKTIMTYKRFVNDTIHGVEEVEVEVSDFERATTILACAGLKKKSHQETRREIWHLDGCEVMIDEWPWLAPFVEIEGPSEQGVRAVAKKLGFAWEDHVIGAVFEAYKRQYPHLTSAATINQMPEITFDMPIPAELRS